MIRVIFFAVTLSLLLLATPLTAQEPATIDYAEWDKTADAAEALAESADATYQQLGAKRAEIADWRRQFQRAQDVSSSEIKIIRDQLAALGPKPAEGETEDAEIAQRRTELEKSLAELQVPELRAIEAFSRADAVIGLIDDAQIELEAEVLARLSPSPLLPSSWSAASKDARALIAGVATEFRERTVNRDIWGELKPQLPYFLVYLAGAIFLLTFGRVWVKSLPSRLTLHRTDYSRAVVAFVVSLLQIALPISGLFLLILAVEISGLPGPWTEPFWDKLGLAGVFVFSGYWLSRQIFPPNPVAYDTLTMDSRARAIARRMTNFLAALWGLHHLLSAAALPLSGLSHSVGEDSQGIPLELSESFASVSRFLIIVIASIALFRLGNALRKLRKPEAESTPGNRYRVLSVLGKLSRPLAILTVVIAAMGFVTLANAWLWPWLLSLALVCLLILLKDFAADLVLMYYRGAEGTRDGLLPMVIGFALIALSVPFFLLIWGASGTELAEIWGKIRSGIKVGGITLSPGTVLTLLIVFIIGYTVTRALQRMLKVSILPKTRLDAGGQNAVVSGLGYVGIILAVILAITTAGIDMSSLAIVAGALSVGIGFGLQNIVSNFVSGIILLIERPISIGDWIQAGGQQGIVKRISVRSTQVETFDKTEVIVPNSDLISQPVINWTRNNQTGRIIVPLTVAFGSDARKVSQILQEIIEDQPLVTVDPAPFVVLRGFGPDGLNFEVRAILSDVGSGITVTSDVCHEILTRFAAEGIEIAVAQRQIRLKTTEGEPDPIGTIQASPAKGRTPPAPTAKDHAARDLPDGADGEGR